jgi:ribose transport system substrate-binding protein
MDGRWSQTNTSTGEELMFKHKPGRTPHGRWVVLLIGVATASIILPGCGSSSSSSSASSSAAAGPTSSSSSAAAAKSPFPDYIKTLAPPAFKPSKKPLKIIFLDASTVLPQQKSIEVGAQAAASKYGIKLSVLDAGGFQNLTTQVGQFQTALGESPDAIMILPASPVAFNSEIKQAEAKHIKVLPLLIPPPAIKFDYALADDLPLDAAKSIDSLASATGGKGHLLAIIGGAGSSVAQLFTQGMTQELKKYPNLKLDVTKTLSGYTPSDAQTAAQNAVVSHPDINAIVTNDTILGVGAAKGLKVEGKTVPIAGIGPGDKATVNALKSGEITVGSGPPFYAIGYDTVVWADYLLQGHKAPQQVQTVAPVVVSKSNIAQAISSGGLFQVLAPSAVGCGPGQPSQC